MRERKPKKPRRSMTAITLWLSGILLLVWGASMFLLTMAAAHLLYDKLYLASQDVVEYAENTGALSCLYGPEEYTEQVEYGMFEKFTATEPVHTNHFSQFRQSDSDRLFRFFPLRNISIPMDTAIIFYNKDGTILHQSGNYLYFWYAAQEVWDAGAENDTSCQSFGWIDLDEEREQDAYGIFHDNLSCFPILRITGTIEGTQVKPAALSYVDKSGALQALEKWMPEYSADSLMNDNYSSIRWPEDLILSGLDRDGLLDWQLLFDHTGELDSSDGLVTVYARQIYEAQYEESPLSFLGERYDSLLSLAASQDILADGYPLSWVNQGSLNQIVYFSYRTYEDMSGYTGAEDEPLPEPDFIMATAVSSHPLKAAVSALRNVYIVTFLLAAALVLLARAAIQKHLVVPLRTINDGIKDDWGHVYSAEKRPELWHEADELYEHYCTQQDWRRYAQNEMARLTAALDYAQKAEQNRRQMASSIAHELKTPLAIIHSYSEGLKEHIAEDKREQYLDVILSEAEHMDGMVLEMLDLSRLEAGKVKLARDEFSLSDLARSIFDKLGFLAQEKGLTVTLELDDDCIIIADEARIGQVITNFASNAVRYTPAGGTVLVKTWSRNGETGFSVENTGEPFTSEELSKVWDTFYRGDKSRGSGGTGLGLAIVKNIVKLHGGTCTVQNTETGVEFGFTLSGE